MPFEQVSREEFTIGRNGPECLAVFKVICLQPSTKIMAGIPHFSEDQV